MTRRREEVKKQSKKSDAMLSANAIYYSPVNGFVGFEGFHAMSSGCCNKLFTNQNDFDVVFQMNGTFAETTL